MIHHEGVDHQLCLDHRHEKFITDLYVLSVQQIAILEVPVSNLVCNSSFFFKTILHFGAGLQFKVPASSSS